MNKKKIIEEVEKKYKTYDTESSLIENDGWDMVILEKELEDIAKENNISLDDLKEIIEDYRKDNIDKESDNIDIKKEKRKPKISVGLVILIGGIAIFIAVILFLKSLFNDNAKELNINSKNSDKQINRKVTQNSIKNPLVVDSTKFVVKKASKVETNNSKNTIKKEQINNIKESRVVKKNSSVQCFSNVKYLNKEIIYFTKEEDRYIPISEKSNWNKKGYILKDKLIGNSFDNKEKMVEVESGKWLPIELFDRCTLIGK